MMTRVSRREFGRAIGAMSMGGLLPKPYAAGASAGANGMGGQPGLDVARARRETPGVARVAHFNNAGSSLPPRAVIDAVQGHLRLESEIGGYEAADAAAGARRRAYAAIAELLSCTTDEIALVENATRAWDMAFYSVAFEKSDRILTCNAEYASNYIAYLQVARRTGAVIEVIPDDEHGQVSLEALERMLGAGRVKLVGVTHVPTNGGLVNPAEEIGKLTERAGALYLLDACQSAGQRPLDVNAIRCDMLSVTGRKFLRGPRGTGFLYVRKSRIAELEPPLLDLHAATWVERDRYEIAPTARRFENWESFVAGQIGLGVAVDYAMGWGLASISARVVALAAHLRDRLARVPGCRVTDVGLDKCGIVTFTLDGRTPAAVRDALRAQGINVSVTSRSSTRLDMERRGLDSMVRASVHYYNTEDEIERLVTAVAAHEAT